MLRQFKLGATTILLLTFTQVSAQDSVSVGVLHSLSGTMAISEISVVNATKLAITEINASGGVLGRQITSVLKDGASEPLVFALQARLLIEQDNVVTVFGGWTSASRQAMLPIFEETQNLLWYPVQFEGNECSPNIMYSGAQPNQQILPALMWALEQNYRHIYLLGSDYVFPRTANQILRTHIAKQGATTLGEAYVLLGDTDFADILAEITQLEPDIIFNTLNGDSNIAFFRQFQQAGFDAETLPVISFSIAEQEAQVMGAELVQGHYAAWNYFQSLELAANRDFIANYQAVYGQDAVITDPMVHAYVNVYAWRAAVEAAASFEVDAVRQAAYGLELVDMPMGTVRISSNQSFYQTVYVGQLNADGQFDILWDSGELIAPEPYDPLVFPGQTCDFAVTSP